MVKMIFLFIMTISFSVCVGREILDGVSSSTNGGNITGTFIGFQKLNIPSDLILIFGDPVVVKYVDLK